MVKTGGPARLPFSRDPGRRPRVSWVEQKGSILDAADAGEAAANEASGWMRELQSQQPEVAAAFERGVGLTAEASAWLSEAGAAIQSLLPRGHVVAEEWRRFRLAMPPAADAPNWRVAHATWQALSGVFAAAQRLVERDRIKSFEEQIRCDTEIDVLDLAATLLAQRITVAATVLAGGALEVHLKNLCAASGLVVAQPFSIAKFDAAIAQERTNGATVYEKADSSQVIGWGQLRNAAAHDPTTFTAGTEQVALMIAGIRNFIARVRAA